MRTTPGTPVHCIQLWSCQIDVVSEEILQEGSWAPRWKQLMVFLLISSTSPHKKAKYLYNSDCGCAQVADDNKAGSVTIEV